MADWSATVDDPAVQAELRAVLTSAIDELPADHRPALVPHDVEGWSNPEIAAGLTISVPAVKARVHRARLFLRSPLDDYVTAAGDQRRRRDTRTVGPRRRVPAACAM